MQFMHSRGYEKTALWIARLFLAFQFGVAAYFKIMGFSGEAAMTAGVGVPFSKVAVGLALILEVVGVIDICRRHRCLALRRLVPVAPLSRY